MKKLTVFEKFFQGTLLFKPPKNLLHCSTTKRRSKNLLTKGIHGINWNSGFYPHSFINKKFVSLRIRFPEGRIFNKGKNKIDSISKHLENVRVLAEHDFRPKKELHKIFVISSSIQDKIEPCKLNDTFWQCKIELASLCQWLQNCTYGNTDGDQSDVSHVNSSFERLHASSSRH